MERPASFLTFTAMMAFACTAGSLGWNAIWFQSWQLATFSLASLLASVLMIALRGRLGHSL